MDDLLSGKLSHFFLVAILDAAVLSWLMLWWYRHSLRTLMARSGAPKTTSAELPRATDGPAGVPPAATIGSPPLTFALFEPKASSGRGGPSADAVDFRRVASAYSVGAMLHAGVVTALELGAAPSSHLLVVWFVTWWTNLWPLVPTLAVLLVLDRHVTTRLTIGYVIVGAVACAAITFVGQIFRQSFNSAPVTNVYWMLVSLLLTVYVPLALIVVTGWRRVRAVTPLALATTLVFGLALFVWHEVLDRAFDIAAARNVLLRMASYSSPTGAYYGLFMIVALPVGYVAWRLLRWLAEGYAEKQFSDVQLVIDCWWLVVTAERVATSFATSYGLPALAWGALAFVTYRLGVAVVLRLWRLSPVSTAPRLLLLRVFGYQARTESLFDRVAQNWRWRGPVTLIAGVDLAMRTIDPGDVLNFLRGGLKEQYVAAADTIPTRVEGMDCARDPDGRFRVNELYCHADTWQPTFQALVGASEIVLMDLRSFAERNAGCIFELTQLMHRLPSDRIVFIYDRTTDLQLLGRVLTEAWASAQRVGLGQGAGQMSVVRVERQSTAELAVLMQRLQGSGAAARVLTPADLPAAVA